MWSSASPSPLHLNKPVPPQTPQPQTFPLAVSARLPVCSVGERDIACPRFILLCVSPSSRSWGWNHQELLLKGLFCLLFRAGGVIESPWQEEGKELFLS